MISKFGKEIRLDVIELSGSSESVIFSSGKLRVDFQVKNLQGLTRGVYHIYNLGNETIRLICNGDRYLRLHTRLHEEEFREVNPLMYVNNAFHEKMIPENRTSLYAVSANEKNFTSKQARMIVNKPTLRNIMTNLVRNTSDKPIRVDFVGFPDDMEDYEPIKAKTYIDGKVEDVIKDLGKQYSFTTSNEDGVVIVTHHPNIRNLASCKWQNREKIKLRDVDMKATPKVGISQLKVKSVIDPDIKPSKILDTSDLVTISIDVGLQVLAFDPNVVNNLISGDSLYSVMSTEHIGSNFTKKWETNAIALKATTGANIDPNNLFGGK